MTVETDVLVIGGGSGGSTAAARLVERGRRVPLFRAIYYATEGSG